MANFIWAGILYFWFYSKIPGLLGRRKETSAKDGHGAPVTASASTGTVSKD